MTDWALLTDAQNGLPAYVIFAAGTGVIASAVVAVTDGQPPEAAMVYDTVYAFTVLDEGITAPVDVLMESPPGNALYTPPVFPVSETF